MIGGVVALLLFTAWGALVVALTLRWLPGLERRWPARTRRVRALAIVAGFAMASPAATYATRPGQPGGLGVAATFLLDALQFGGTLLVVATVVRLCLARLVPGVARRPLLADGVTVALACTVELWRTNDMWLALAVAGLLLVSVGVATAHGVIAAEEGASKPLAVRAGVALAGIVLLAGGLATFAFTSRVQPWGPLASLVTLTGGALVWATLGLALGDAIARLTASARSVRTRLLVLSLAAGAIGFVQSKLPTFVRDDEHRWGLGAVNLVASVVLGAIVLWLVAFGFARRMSRALETSAQALAQVRAGDLDVKLDESGRDEISEVARTFNTMVAQLREAEFLERINEGLRDRSTRLQHTLDALRTAQAELVRAERMASVATLVRGIAHELNNPIGFIAGNMPPLQRYSEFLARVAGDLADGRARTPAEVHALTQFSPQKDLRYVAEDLARLTGDVAEGARRAKLIISDLQGLTAASQRGVERVDVHRAIRQSVSLLSPRVPRGVRIETDLEPVPALVARAGQLEQVLVNLVDNATRAVGDRGVIRVHASSEGGVVRIAVSDDGSGMSAEVRRQACDPFFTTRPPGEGSGLGLAIVASIVRGHGGTLDIDSEEGRGTEIVIRLPAQPDAATAAELEQASGKERLTK